MSVLVISSGWNFNDYLATGIIIGDEIAYALDMGRVTIYRYLQHIGISKKRT